MGRAQTEEIVVLVVLVFRLEYLVTKVLLYLRQYKVVRHLHYYQEYLKCDTSRPLAASVT